MWRDLRVGDIVWIKKGAEVPADVVQLASSEEEGGSYVDTCNLDGETNLKIKSSLAATVLSNNHALISKLQGTLVAFSSLPLPFYSRNTDRHRQTHKNKRTRLERALEQRATYMRTKADRIRASRRLVGLRRAQQAALHLLRQGRNQQADDPRR